jgi:DNA-binding transcriptional LysR family regulator
VEKWIDRDTFLASICHMNLRGVDLNLIPILQALLKESSITGAAKSLRMSQPAVSHALGRLRQLLGDPLLVKVGRDMRLTPRAERLRKLADTSCASISDMLAPEEFDPASVDRKFTVATPDYLALIIGEELIETFRSIAPNVSVLFVDANFRLREETIAGEIDLSIIAYLPEMFEGLCVERGYVDDLVSVAAEDHPIATKGRLNWNDLASYTWLNFNMTAGHPMVPAAARGPAETVVIGASQLLALPLLAARSSSITVVPRALAKLTAAMVPLAINEIDDAVLELCMVWSPVETADPSHSWLRLLISDILTRRCSRPAPK